MWHYISYLCDCRQRSLSFAPPKSDCMQQFFKNFFKGDPIIWFLVFLAMSFSIVLVFSATSNTAFRAENVSGDFYAPIMSHVTHVLLALLICLIGARIHPKYFGKVFFVGLLFAFALLIFTALDGNTLNQGKRWTTILGVQFQPSELARLALINYTAYMLGNSRYSTPQTFWKIFVPAIVMCLMIFMENVSTAALIGLVIFLMCLIGGANRKRLMIVAGAGILVVILGVLTLVALPEKTAVKLGGRLPTAKARMERFFNGRDARDDNPHKSAIENYIASLDIDHKDSQTAYSQIAIAKGGLFGVGAGKSETRYILPHPYSDFIYSMIAEEYGLVGCGFVILAYIVLFFRIAQIAQKTQSMYMKLLLMGIGFAITIQAAVNMAVATGVGPVTGQPLPFLSRGGTSYVITSVYFAVLLSVTNYIRRDAAKREAYLLTQDGDTEVELEAFPEVPEVDAQIYGED